MLLVCVVNMALFKFGVFMKSEFIWCSVSLCDYAVNSDNFCVRVCVCVCVCDQVCIGGPIHVASPVVWIRQLSGACLDLFQSESDPLSLL